jgi:crotonobetainyl-CoA:carnitine CoA-transferase CaiB-like acyl-CoA transferase
MNMTDRLPLQGVTVVELGHSVAAPFAGEILGDLGAEVIKVEKRDGGDDARKWGPPFWHGSGAAFQSLNRNKRSVVVELRDAADNARLKQFILDNVDVVIQNLRPGLVAELGLDGPSLRRVKPDLIYSTIGAFGAAGPFKNRPGYDPLMQAFAGLMAVTGEPGRPPVRVGTSIIDMAAGMWSVIGIVSALLRRAQGGSGATIDTSLYETALAWMGYHAANYQASNVIPERQGSGAVFAVPYRGYATKDAFIVVGAANDKLFASFARVLGRPEWIEDARFRTNPDRVKNQTVLYPMIEKLVGARTTEDLRKALDAAQVPNAPIQTIDQVLAHEQTKALGILQKSPDGKFTLLGSPLSIDGERLPFRRSPPALGAHTEEVLGNAQQNPPKVRQA